MLLGAAVFLGGCRKDAAAGAAAEYDSTIRMAASGRVKTLDPTFADDLASRDMVGALFDTLLAYDYKKRPYELVPSMLETMPESIDGGKSYRFKLRDDLYFCKDACFETNSRKERKITSQDVVYSFLRIADGRLHSPVFWMFRNKIVGIDEFRGATGKLEPGDNRLYDQGIPGLEIHNDREFTIHLNAPDPRFLYNLAIPYASILSRKAVEYYGEDLREHPVGSGPFKLVKWALDYELVLERNEEYREETYAGARSEGDRTKRLPLADRIVVYTIRQPITAWLLFLQGNLDVSKLDKDNCDIVIGGDLSPALRERGVTLLRAPEFELQYIGFNFTEPILGNNEALRKAISLAFNLEGRIEYSNGQMMPVSGPIPPGVSGCDENFVNPYGQYNIEKAKKYMIEAGYPNGIDPATGEPLTLTFDLNGNGAMHRQLGEMMASDMEKIGIKIIVNLNNSSRFFQKLRQGQMQLFRLSWVGDYPDGENFLQLFYSKNAGGCNRIFYRDAEYDRLFEEIIPMADSPERTEKYYKMVKYLTERCPWIFESMPLTYQLKYDWLENFEHHNFPFNRWKYIKVDGKRREEMRAKFRPLSFREMQ